MHSVNCFIDKLKYVYSFKKLSEFVGSSDIDDDIDLEVIKSERACIEMSKSGVNVRLYS